MTMFKGLVVVAAAAAAAILPASAEECPAAVKEAAENVHPSATAFACKEENEHGKLQYKVKVTVRNGRNLALDVSPDGTILLSEATVPLNGVPAKVMESLAAKYPDAKATAARKHTDADGTKVYEVAFESGKEKKSATFASDGTFVEEEEEGD